MGLTGRTDYCRKRSLALDHDFEVLARQHQLLAIAEANGLRELEAVARRWRGEALLAENVYGEAQAELSRAAALAEDIGRVRLQMDAGAALARLFVGQGQTGAAQRHAAKARAIAEAIEESLVSSGLEGRLSIT